MTSPEPFADLNFCQRCGHYGATNKSKDHQTKGWESHKTSCKAVVASPVSLWIRVEEGEGSGLANTCTNHIFCTKAAGLAYVRDCLGAGPPLRSPFCELAGWDVVLYCSGEFNDVDTRQQRVNGKVSGHVNAAGIYLGSDLDSGMTRYNNMSGPIFLTGRQQKDGKPLHKDILWGLMNFLWDAMDLYDGGLDLPAAETLQKWATEYKAESWAPQGGDGGVDVYSHDIMHGSEDHR